MPQIQLGDEHPEPEQCEQHRPLTQRQAKPRPARRWSRREESIAIRGHAYLVANGESLERSTWALVVR
ncbi:MAG: hypothetical protein RL685_6650 [Pseudomonadota bacterium]|jgi:hypothetical protein